MSKLFYLLNTIIGKVNDCIKTTAQVLTDDQKAQARKNIGAAAEGEGGGGSSVQSDWNQRDETAPDFLKNKPFGETENVILEEQELVYDPNMEGHVGFVSAPIGVGDTLRIVFDGEVYECGTEYNLDLQAVMFGNFAILGYPEDSGEPFLGGYMGDGAVLFIAADEASYNVKISVLDVQKLDSKFYNGGTMFFTDGTFLFTDSALSIKATKTDVEKAFFGGSVVVKFPALSTAWQPVSFNGISYSYGVVCCMEWRGDNTPETIFFYTAEYTPET